MKPGRELLAALEKRGIGYRRQESLARHTTLGIGGPTPLFLAPHSAQSLLAALELLARYGCPFRCLGAGSNLLVDDRPLSFAVVALKGVEAEPVWSDEGVEAEAGVFLPTLARAAAGRGREGLEFAIGIPGSLGGALRMNAGAWGRCLGDLVSDVDLAEAGPDGVRVTSRRPGFRYRAAELAPGEVVLRLRLRLGRAPSADLLAIQAEHIARRRRTQPTASRSAGCMFRNPPGDAAGRLIDAAGLKGLRVGAAEVSTLHANFVLNRGGAGFHDVQRLLDEVRSRVEGHAGVELVPEVVVWRADGE